MKNFGALLDGLSVELADGKEARIIVRPRVVRRRKQPQWRDLMWFEWIMRKEGDYYVTSVPGSKHDAYMFEVADAAMGFPGYVTSLPIKLTGAPIRDRLANEAGWMGPRVK